MSETLRKQQEQQTLEIIYDAATQPELWPEVLQQFIRLVDADMGLFAIEKQDRSELISYQDLGFDDHGIAQYADHYVARDIWLQDLVAKPQERFHRSHLVTSQKAYLNSEFYVDWSKQYKMHHAMGAVLERPGFDPARLSVQRSNKRGNFTAEEEARANRLWAHLSRALRIRQQLGLMTTTGSGAMAVFGQLRYAAFLVDSNCEVRHQNDLAEELLTARRGVALSTGRLHFIDSNVRLQKLVLNSIASARRMEVASSTTLDYQDTLHLELKDGHTLEVRVTPFVVSELFFSNQYRKVLALVVIRDLQWDAPIDKQVASSLYNLTPRESDVCLALCGGLTLDQTARKLNVSLHTVRTHVKRLYQKTGTTTQSQCVAKVMAGVARIVTD